MSNINDAMDEVGEAVADRVMRNLDHLKRTLHPEEDLNIIDQCKIVSEALGFGSPYDENRDDLAEYLDISPNQVYKMKCIHDYTLPEMKTYLYGTQYKTHTAYTFAVMSHESQRVFLDSEKTLERGVGVTDYLSSDRTKIGGEI